MYKLQIDNFIFHVNVTEYSPAIPGTWDKRADNPDEFYGESETLDWSCYEMFELVGDKILPVDCKDTIDVVDIYAERITEQLLMKIAFEQECAGEVW